MQQIIKYVLVAGVSAGVVALTSLLCRGLPAKQAGTKSA